MASSKPHRPRAGSRQPKATRPAQSRRTDVAPEVVQALEEIQHILDTPLVELMGSEAERAEAEELTRQAVGAPVTARLREVVAFVGRGRPATQAGNLRAADALALARRLGTDHDVPDLVGSIKDLPDTAHAFRWAAAAEFLAWRGTKIVAGPLAPDLERDPVSAWFAAAATLFEHGLLDGFRQGWRKSYVELLDANAPAVLAAILVEGGAVPITMVEDLAWEQVAGGYGYEPDDDDERRHVVKLVGGMVARLVDLAAVTRRDDDVVLTGLGSALAVAAAMSSDEGPDEFDLMDVDAHSLLLVCVDEMEPAEAGEHLRAWCQARPADEAADELCEAIRDDDDADVWRLGMEALAMIDPAVAEPAVRGLQADPRLRPLATTWLARHGGTPKRQTPG